MGSSSTAIPQKTVEFIRMDEGSKEDYQLLHALEQRYIEKLPDRILTALDGLKDSLAGYKVTRLEHSLQTATRAEKHGADDELIVAALIHDIGDDLAPENHRQMAAAIIRPYVRSPHGSGNASIYSRWYIMLTNWGWIRMSGSAIVAINGLTMQNNSAVTGISCHLTLIILHCRLAILKTGCAPFSHGRHLILKFLTPQPSQAFLAC